MGIDRSPVALLAFGSAVPAHQIEQAALGRWMAEAFDWRSPLSEWIRRLYRTSGIETRYSCLPDPLEAPARSRFSPGRALEESPTTAERMAIYQRDATEIGTRAGQRALADADGGAGTAAASSVTHLIVVSCTGFFAPGLDQMIAKRLGLRPTVERALIGFMGCAAAFNALRLARQIVSGNADARVLVVCVELCSLHIQPGDDRVNLVVESLFADGAAACLVGTPQGDGDHFLLDGFYSELVPDTAEKMVWEIGDHGFTLHLAPDIPQRLGEVAPQALAALLGAGRRPKLWAIHPGGRAIVDRLAELFALTPADVASSRGVLRRYGNMSSPTILFVLDDLRARLRQAQVDAPQEGVAMAFGPGLVVEMARLSYIPQPSGEALETAAATPVAYVA